MRYAEVKRKTTETDIALKLNIDCAPQTGEYGYICTSAGFLDHMLALFARHANFGVRVECVGDTRVDYHHTTEDIGIALGEALSNALGDKRGIARYGDATIPMDEALILCAIDLSGRAYLNYNLSIPAQKVGDFDTELVKEFFWGFTRGARCTLHMNMLSGDNSHHIIEAAFKAFARALAKAVRVCARCADDIPSTKGIL